MNEAAYQAILTRLGLEPAVQARSGALDWNAEYRALAAVTNNITKEDPRFARIMAALDQCDIAFFANDWPAFQRAAEEARQAAQRPEQVEKQSTEIK